MLANGNIPYHRHHALRINQGWLGGKNLSVSLASSVNSETHEFCKFCNCCSGTGCTIGCWAVRKIVLCIACFAYSVIVVVVVIVIVITVPSFFVFLNCLYLNPQVLLFVHCPPHPTVGGGVSERLSVPSSQLPG